MRGEEKGGVGKGEEEKGRERMEISPVLMVTE